MDKRRPPPPLQFENTTVAPSSGRGLHLVSDGLAGSLADQLIVVPWGWWNPPRDPVVAANPLSMARVLGKGGFLSSSLFG